MIPQQLIEDLKEFAERGYLYEIVESSNKVYVFFKQYPLPEGIFNLDKTDLLVFTTPQYPNSGFDMFWVDENLTLKDGRPPRSAEQFESHLGRRWRRFSIHPYNQKHWNPGEDDISQFMTYVEKRLRNGD